MDKMEIQNYISFFNFLRDLETKTNYQHTLDLFTDFVDFHSYAIINDIDVEEPFANEYTATTLLNFAERYIELTGYSNEEILYLPFSVDAMLLELATIEDDFKPSVEVKSESDISLQFEEEEEEADEIIEDDDDINSKLNDIHNLLFPPATLNEPERFDLKPKKKSKKEIGEEIKANYKAVSRLKILNS